jgi:hypothetical protein
LANLLAHQIERLRAFVFRPASAQNRIQSVQRRRFDIFLGEPEKPEAELPQIISRMTDRQLARSPERLGSMPPQRRNAYFGWTRFHRQHARVVMTHTHVSTQRRSRLPDG